MNNIKQEITNFLSEFINIDNVNADDDLFESGLINSLFAMQLVLFIEKKFSLKVENEDLQRKNFNSISSVENFLKRKLSLVKN